MFTYNTLLYTLPYFLSYLVHLFAFLKITEVSFLNKFHPFLHINSSNNVVTSHSRWHNCVSVVCSVFITVSCTCDCQF